MINAARKIDKLLFPLLLPAPRPPRASSTPANITSINSKIMVLINNTSCMARMNVAPSILCYVHPAFRRFLLRRKVRQCLRKRNISLAKKIRNRSLRYSVLPRVAPFLCSKCGFATVVLKKIEEHVCMKKSSSVIDLERDMKVAQMGLRSRCKDAMAILERIPNPQSIRLPRFRILENEPSAEMFEMICSSISPINSIPKVVDSVARCSNDEKVEKCAEDNSLNELNIKGFHCTQFEMTLRGSCTCSEYMKHDDSRTAISVETLAEHKMDHQICKYHAKEMFSVCCTACGIQSGEFETMGDFHEHIMKCGECCR
ncbi:unnamed protein product [Litomosoides sigmodontis]|uniref:Uncharacterized protein n=1 Tax=Litomosoides sigmodontis TaxID=42156 RepID=A0A3P6RYT1_LITSI|nr:unnamed protein product [Litomosoides sigmodontis]